MESARSYSSEKRNKNDRCNICGKVSDLTWDHVPPKFCFNDKRTQYNSIFEISKQKKYTHIAQNGIKYRTICAECNNNLLGSNYDKEYKKLVDKLCELYIKIGTIPQYLEITNLKVNKIARSIVGHFLAARKEYNDGKLENELRKYLLNDKLKPPKDFKLLYYVYIYNTMMIIRDIFPKKFGKAEYSIPEGFISCMNSFPLAFILGHNCENNPGLYDLFEICTEDIDENLNIKIDLLSYMYPNRRELRDPYWPCNISDGETGTSMMLVGDDSNSSVFSKTKNIKIQKE